MLPVDEVLKISEVANQRTFLAWANDGACKIVDVIHYCYFQTHFPEYLLNKISLETFTSQNKR